MSILLILIACTKAFFLLLGVDKIARISQTRNYMQGALITSTVLGIYTSQMVRRIYGESPGLEMFGMSLALFASISVLGFLYCKLLGIKPPKKIYFEPNWFSYALYLFPSFVLILFFYVGTYGDHPWVSLLMLLTVFVFGYKIPSVVLTVSTLMSCCLFGVAVHGLSVAILDTPTADAAMPDDYDATDMDVDNSDSVTTIDTTDGTGVEHVDGHYREGTYVHGYSRADGTWVDGHYRDGGEVSPHLRKK